MPGVARLTIDLDDVSPRVRRRIEVPLDIRLDDLHLVFQIAMGWENYHLFEFRLGRKAWGIPDPDVVDPSFAENEPLAADRATLADILAGGRKAFAYAYDFGDDWLHTVKVDAVVDAATDVAYPQLVAAEGACPPEDVGGPHGYAEYLKAMADPNHEDHDRMVAWRGPRFDPAAVDQAAIRKRFAALAKRRARSGRRVKAKPSR